MMDVLYVTPGPDGMDFEYTQNDERALRAMEQVEECRNHFERLYRYLIFITLTRGVKGKSYGKNKTSPR
jgi:hypothetical protein